MGSWMIRKCSKGVISTKISLAKGIRSKTGAPPPPPQHDLINTQRTIKHWIMTAVNDHHNHVFYVTHTIYYQFLVLALVYTCAWWRHQMKHIPRYWPFVWEIHRSPVNSPNKGQWHRALIFYICAWINGWVNNREAGDLRRNRAHYDVVVMVNLLFTYGMSYQITIDIVLFHNCCIWCVCVRK